MVAPVAHVHPAARVRDSVRVLQTGKNKRSVQRDSHAHPSECRADAAAGNLVAGVEAGGWGSNLGALTCRPEARAAARPSESLSFNMLSVCPSATYNESPSLQRLGCSGWVPFQLGGPQGRERVVRGYRNAGQLCAGAASSSTSARPRIEYIS